MLLAVLILYLFNFINLMKAEEKSQETRYIDFLPEEVKREFIAKIARRIIEEVKANDTDRKNEEGSNKSLDLETTFVNKLLKEEEELVKQRKEDKNKPVVRRDIIDDIKVKNKEKKRKIIDLTIREGGGTQNKYDFSLEGDDDPPIEIEEVPAEDVETTVKAATVTKPPNKEEKYSVEIEIIKDKVPEKDIQQQEIPVQVIYDDPSKKQNQNPIAGTENKTTTTVPITTSETLTAEVSTSGDDKSITETGKKTYESEVNVAEPEKVETAKNNSEIVPESNVHDDPPNDNTDQKESTTNGDDTTISDSESITETTETSDNTIAPKISEMRESKPRIVETVVSNLEIGLNSSKTAPTYTESVNNEGGLTKNETRTNNHKKVPESKIQRNIPVQVIYEDPSNGNTKVASTPTNQKETTTKIPTSVQTITIISDNESTTETSKFSDGTIVPKVSERKESKPKTVENAFSNLKTVSKSSTTAPTNFESVTNNDDSKRNDIKTVTNKTEIDTNTPKVVTVLNQPEINSSQKETQAKNIETATEETKKTIESADFLSDLPETQKTQILDKVARRFSEKDHAINNSKLTSIEITDEEMSVHKKIVESMINEERENLKSRIGGKVEKVVKNNVKVVNERTTEVTNFINDLPETKKIEQLDKVARRFMENDTLKARGNQISIEVTDKELAAHKGLVDKPITEERENIQRQPEGYISLSKDKNVSSTVTIDENINMAPLNLAKIKTNIGSALTNPVQKEDVVRQSNKSNIEVNNNAPKSIISDKAVESTKKKVEKANGVALEPLLRAELDLDEIKARLLGNSTFNPETKETNSFPEFKPLITISNNSKDIAKETEYVTNLPQTTTKVITSSFLNMNPTIDLTVTEPSITENTNSATNMTTIAEEIIQAKTEYIIGKYDSDLSEEAKVNNTGRIENKAGVDWRLNSDSKPVNVTAAILEPIEIEVTSKLPFAKSFKSEIRGVSKLREDSGQHGYIEYIEGTTSRRSDIIQEDPFNSSATTEYLVETSTATVFKNETASTVSTSTEVITDNITTTQDITAKSTVEESTTNDPTTETTTTSEATATSKPTTTCNCSTSTITETTTTTETTRTICDCPTTNKRSPKPTSNFVKDNSKKLKRSTKTVLAFNNVPIPVGNAETVTEAPRPILTTMPTPTIELHAVLFEAVKNENSVKVENGESSNNASQKKNYEVFEILPGQNPFIPVKELMSINMGGVKDEDFKSLARDGPITKEEKVAENIEVVETNPMEEQVNYAPIHYFVPENAYFSSSNRYRPDPDSALDQKQNEPAKKMPRVKLMDVKDEDLKPLIIEGTAAEEQSNYAPVHNYAPENAYFSPSNRYEPNPGFDKEDTNFEYDNIEKDDESWSLAKSRPEDGENQALRVNKEKNIIELVEKGDKREMHKYPDSNIFNVNVKRNKELDEFFGLQNDDNKQLRYKYSSEEISKKKGLYAFPNSNEPEHPYNALVKNHYPIMQFQQAQQIMHNRNYFGTDHLFKTTTDPNPIENTRWPIIATQKRTKKTKKLSQRIKVMPAVIAYVNNLRKTADKQNRDVFSADSQHNIININEETMPFIRKLIKAQIHNQTLKGVKTFKQPNIVKITDEKELADLYKNHQQLIGVKNIFRVKKDRRRKHKRLNVSEIKNDPHDLSNQNRFKSVRLSNETKRTLNNGTSDREATNDSNFDVLTGNPSLKDVVKKKRRSLKPTTTKPEEEIRDVVKKKRTHLRHTTIKPDETEDSREELDFEDDEPKKPSLRDRPTREYAYYSDPNDISSGDVEAMKTLNTEAIELVLNLTETDKIYPILAKLNKLYSANSTTNYFFRRAPGIESDVETYIRVIQDMIRMGSENRALTNYDWLATTVDIRSAIQKLVDLSQRVKVGTFIHPEDLQLLKYVLYIHESSDFWTEFHNDLRRVNQFRKPFDPITVRPWLVKPSNSKALRDFEAFWSDLQNYLNDLHDAIKHIAMITKFKNQHWFKNLKELYLVENSRKQALEVLLHLLTANFMDMMEAANANGLRHNYVAYAMNNKQDVVNTKNEFDFIVKVFNLLKKKLINYFCCFCSSILVMDENVYDV